MSTYLTAVPACFPAGTSLLLRILIDGYPAGGSAEATLFLQGKSKLEAIADDTDGQAFVWNIGADLTDDLEAGVYKWAIRVDTDDGIFQPLKGTTNVEPDMAAAAAGDLQDPDEKLLELVEAAIAGRIPAGMDSYQIRGRAVSKIPLSELLKLRRELRAAIRAKKTPGLISRPVRIRFSGTGNES